MKRNLLIVLIIVVILIIVGMIIFSEKNPENSKDSNNNSMVSEESLESLNISDTTQEIINSAISGADFDLCNQIENENQKEICKLKVNIHKAKIYNDLNICEQLSQKFKVECKDDVIMYNAIGTKNPGYCEEIINKDKKEQCINQASN